MVLYNIKPLTITTFFREREKVCSTGIHFSIGYTLITY